MNWHHTLKEEEEEYDDVDSNKPVKTHDQYDIKVNNCDDQTSKYNPQPIISSKGRKSDEDCYSNDFHPTSEKKLNVNVTSLTEKKTISKLDGSMNGFRKKSHEEIRLGSD